jgi:hypothetical protein
LGGDKEMEVHGTMKCNRLGPCLQLPADTNPGRKRKREGKKKEGKKNGARTPEVHFLHATVKGTGRQMAELLSARVCTRTRGLPLGSCIIVEK